MRTFNNPSAVMAKGLSAFAVAILLASCTIPSLPQHSVADGIIMDMRDTIKGVEISYLYDGVLEFAPENPRAGIVFYPGALVDYKGYAPLMGMLAQRGFHCLLCQMPADFAILDGKTASLVKQFPEISDWYLAGHSLGGAKAAMALKENCRGVILLGAYSSVDISGHGWQAVSIYGSEDHVLNRDNYEKYRANLPADYKELVIEGGCHSYFAVYGHQKGDGTPTISREEQMRQTAEFIDANVRTE